MNKEAIEEIKQEIIEIKENWPAHSPPPGMLLRLEVLEDKLLQITKDLKGENNASD